MPNTFDAVLSALGPDHTWKMDEASGLYVDSGSGSLDLTPSLPAATWRQAPGVIRGEPREYGFWDVKNSDTGNGGIAAAETPSGWTTGTWGCWAQIFDITALDFMYPLAMAYNGNPNISGWMRVGQSVSGTGAWAQMRIRDGADFISWRTDAGAIIPGEPYFVCFVHDGVSPVVYLNGVQVADSHVTLAGASVASDYFDGVIGSVIVSSVTNINGLAGATETARGLFQRPFVFRNQVLTAAEIASLFAAGNVDGVFTDYYETVPGITENTLRYWLPGWSINANGRMPMQGVAPQTDADGEEATFVPNIGSGNNVATEITGTDYAAFKQIYAGTTQIQMPEPAMVDGTETTGTINIIGTTREVDAAGGTKNIYYHGHNLGPNPEEEISIGLQGSASGAQIVFTINTANAANFWIATGDTFIPINTFVMISVVQDGAGIKLYLNGVAETFTISTGGAGIDSTSWFADLPFAGIDDPNADVLVLGGEDGAPGTKSWEPNELNEAWMCTKAMTAAEIAEIWDAVNDIFPPEIPPGVWVTTLEQLCNGAAPEGPGPDWWWRMNVAAGVIVDVGVAQNRGVPIDGDAIAEGGNPLHEVSGPLPLDLTNDAIYFDGVGDYFEIGVNGVPGQLAVNGTGTVGCFFSRNANVAENIIYSQGNDAYTAFWQFGLSGLNPQLIVQTSAGNSATYTSSIKLTNAFSQIILTNDGSKYRIYIDGVEDTDAKLTLAGTGAEGDWFDAFAADQSAVGARADATFTTQTTGRISELFICDGDVLSPTQIETLADAAIADGITGAPNPVGILVFENVTFRNGAFADIRAEESTGNFQQVIKGTRCHFLGGQQGDATTKPQMVLLKGPAHAQFRGCDADLQATPSFGRGGIVGTAINTALSAVQDGSILVSDCDFDEMGYLNGSDFLSPVMCQAAFGMTVEESRFRSCLGTAVGWLADAQRVAVINNQIEGTTQALAAIYAAQGLNARLGSGWTIRGNKAIDTAGNAIDLNGVSSAGGTQFARNIAIIKNETDNNTTGVGIRANQLSDLIIAGNKSNRCTEGIRLGALASAVMVRRNEVTENTLTAIIAAESTLQLVDLTLDRNKINGGVALGDGITVTNVRRANIIENKLRTLDLGIQIGEISVEANIGGNDVGPGVATPFALLGGTTQVGLRIGNQIIPVLGNANQLTVAADTITATAHQHAITIAVAGDLDTVNGPLVDGWLLILRRAPSSQTMTARDGVDNLNLAGDFAMSTDNSQLWLVRDGANWHEVSRFLA